MVYCSIVTGYLNLEIMAKMPDAGSAAIAKHLNLDPLDVEIAMSE